MEDSGVYVGDLHYKNTLTGHYRSRTKNLHRNDGFTGLQKTYRSIFPKIRKSLQGNFTFFFETAYLKLHKSKLPQVSLKGEGETEALWTANLLLYLRLTSKQQIQIILQTRQSFLK